MKAEILIKRKLYNPLLIVWRAFYYSINHWWCYEGDIYNWVEKEFEPMIYLQLEDIYNE